MRAMWETSDGRRKNEKSARGGDVFRPTSPLGRHPRRALCHIAGTSDSVSELDWTAGLLAAPADLCRIGDSARRILSILTTIVTDRSDTRDCAVGYGEIERFAREAKRPRARQQTSPPANSLLVAPWREA
jgi:hypothetical protein